MRYIYFPKNSRGQSAIEFAVFIPIVLFILYAVTDLSLMFIDYQKISSLCAQTAEIAYTKCNGKTSTDLSTCLTEACQEVAASADKLFPNFSLGTATNGKIIASYYYYVVDPLEGGGPAVIQLSQSYGTDAGVSRPSKFSVSGSTLQGGGISLNLSLHEVVTTGEVYYKFSKKTQIWDFLKITPPNYYYESSVY